MATRRGNLVNTALRIADYPDTEKEDHSNYLNEYSCKPPPVFLLLISFLQVVVFIWHCTELNARGTPVDWKGPPLLQWRNASMDWDTDCKIYWDETDNWRRPEGCVLRNESLHYDPGKIKHKWQIWRYITYAFVHSGYAHIIFNVVIQIVVGVPLELVHRWYRIIPIYFGGVLAGALSNI